MAGRQPLATTTRNTVRPPPLFREQAEETRCSAGSGTHAKAGDARAREGCILLIENHEGHRHDGPKASRSNIRSRSPVS